MIFLIIKFIFATIIMNYLLFLSLNTNQLFGYLLLSFFMFFFFIISLKNLNGRSKELKNSLEQKAEDHPIIKAARERLGK